MSETRVAMVVSGDVRYDGRVRREAETLRRAGYSVRVHDQGQYSPSSFVRMRFLTRVLGDVTGRPPDVVHCHDLDTLPLGVAAKVLLGCRLIYDVHEFWGAMVAETKPSIVGAFFDRIEPILSQRVDALIAANEGVCEYLRQMGFASLTVHNYAPRPEGEWGPPLPPFYALYLGTIMSGRLIPIDMTAVRVRGVKGDSIPVPNEQVVAEMRKAHAILSMYDPNRPSNRAGMPNKVYEAMAAGRPCLVTEETRAGDVVSKLGSGWALRYDRIFLDLALHDLAEHPDLVEAMGRNGYRAAQAEYNWEHEEPLLLSLYRRLE